MRVSPRLESAFYAGCAVVAVAVLAFALGTRADPIWYCVALAGVGAVTWTGSEIAGPNEANSGSAKVGRTLRRFGFLALLALAGYLLADAMDIGGYDGDAVVGDWVRAP